MRVVVVLAAVAIVAIGAGCGRDALPPTPTAITFPPTPTAITFPPTPTPISIPLVATPLALPPTPTAITFPPTPTAITIPPTPTAITIPPTPTAITLPSVPSQGAPRPSTADIVALVSPSVVQIQVQTSRGQGSGTGVILKEDGLILTNAHVVNGALQIGVSLFDDRVFRAEIIGEDPTVDIALISIDATGLRPAMLGDSSAVRVGEDVIAIGHALALPGGPTVSKGVISALGRSLGGGPGGPNTLSDLIQTDAAINPGNSGGPLLNTDGEVIGINTAKIEAGEGIGFAIEINTVRVVTERLLHESKLPPGFLGISGINITPALAQIAGLPVSRGVGIIELVRGRAADRAGFQVDDIIVQMGDLPIRDLTDLSRFLRQYRAGETIIVTVIRGANALSIQVTLDEPPSEGS